MLSTRLSGAHAEDWLHAKLSAAPLLIPVFPPEETVQGNAAFISQPRTAMISYKIVTVVAVCLLA